MVGASPGRDYVLTRYHKYARVGVKLPYRESYFDHNKNLAHKLVPTLRSGKVWQI